MNPEPVGAQLATEEGVYGVILVAGMIVVSGSHELDAWSVFITVVSTVLVFWAAHVYAGTVAHHRIVDGHDRAESRAALRPARAHAGGTGPKPRPPAPACGPRAC